MKLSGIVKITTEMMETAQQETKKRANYISHHFSVNHLSGFQRDVVGFLGEFACGEYLGMDWRINICKTYLRGADNGDLVYNGKIIDVKTETVPKDYAFKMSRGMLSDTDPYGSRMIHAKQYKILNKYDAVLFGMFARGNLNYWCAIGWIETAEILRHYPPTRETPYGLCSSIPNSKLKNIKEL